MASGGLKARILTPRNRKIFRFLIIILSSAAAYAALVSPIANRPSSYTLTQGDVAAQDIQAPYTLDYVSDLLTIQARADAVQNVPAIYLPSDPAIARRQIEKLRSTLNYISVVRNDNYATDEQKLADIAEISDILINAEDANHILTTNSVLWDAIQKESLNVLEQVMHDTIRPDQIREAIRRTPALISYAMPQDQATVVSDLVTPFVSANSLFSAEQTDQAKQEAVNNIGSVSKRYVSGEIIVRRGQIITPLTWEALQKYGLIQTENNTHELLAALALVVLLAGFTILYFERRKLQPVENLRGPALIALSFLGFLIAARFLIPNRTVVPYIFPIPAFALVIGSLFNLEIGLVLSIVLSILTAFGLPNSLDLTIYYILTSFVGLLVLGKGLRISSFIWAGIAIGAAGSAALIAYRLASSYTDLVGMATLVGASFFYGLASASLTLILQFFFSQILGVTTALQLLEISRPDHPLLQIILQNAPGSYQHSLQVAVMAEQAAEKIGADPLLVRVGGLYHDAGKSLNPAYFIENQPGNNLNPHDDLVPSESAQTIIRHVADGVGLARKYHLPPRIQDFMREHHGTMLTRYQYARALELVNNDPTQVDENLFHYQGPIPNSKETAVLMLADGSQARVRAELPETEDAIREVIKKVVDYCLKEGQLDNTRFTLRDINLITESFVNTLKNSYHPRIRYPEIKPASQESATIPSKRDAT